MIPTDETDLVDLVRETGLNHKESLVYLASLKTGEASASSISSEAGLKRTTTYMILEKLAEKGLVFYRENSKIMKFRAINPMSLIERQKGAVSQLQNALPDLLQLNPTYGLVPQIETRAGFDGIQSIWEDCLDSDEDILYWADSKLTQSSSHAFDWTDTGKEDYGRDFIKRRVKKGLWVRGIIPYENNKNKRKKDGIQRLQNDYLVLRKDGKKELREFYLVDRSDFPLKHEVTIFGDKIAIISYYSAMGIILKSKNLAENFRSIFKMCFKFARQNEKNLVNTEDLKYLTPYSSTYEPNLSEKVT